MSDPQSASQPYGAPSMPSYAPPDSSGDAGLGRVPQSYVPAPAVSTPVGVPQPATMPAPLGPYAASSPYSLPFGVEPEPTQAKNWMGIAALSLGVVSVGLIATIGSIAGGMADATGAVLAWAVVSVLAIVFGAAGIRAAGRHQATNRGMAVAGMVVGIFMSAVLVVIVILAFWVYAQF